MAGAWNPLAPGALGLEWPATREILQPVAPGQPCLAQTLRSNTAETLDALRLRVHRDPAVSDPLFTVVDIFDKANVIPSVARTSIQYAPNADNTADSAIGAGLWERVGGIFVNLFLSIDDVPSVPPADTDFIGINNGTGPEQYICDVASGAFPLTARVCRISIVSVHATRPSPLYGNLAFQYRLWYNPTNTSYTPPFAHFSVGYYGGKVVIDCGEINPVTLLPWTPADVRSFDTGTWQIRVEATGSTNVTPVVWALALQVDYVDPENRVAVATWSRTPTGGGDYADTDDLITLPGGAANWAKPGGGVDHTYLWRPANAPLLTSTSPRADDVQWATMDADLSPVELNQYAPPPGMVADIISVDGYGLALTAATARSAVVSSGDITRAANIGLRVVGPTWSDDSQPYELGLPQLLSVTSALTGPPPGAGQRLRQSTGSTQNYLGVRFPVVPPASGTSTLTVSVNRVSDNVQMGGTLVLNAADVRAMTSLGSSSAKMIEANLSSAAALVSGTQYEIRFVASTTDAWLLLAPEASLSLASTTFLGATDGARSAATVFTDRDIEAILLIQPVAPAGFSAAVDTESFLLATGCQPVQWDHVDLTWTPTALGAAFLRYEIERSDEDAPGVWEVVARLGTEATATWSDYEARRNRESTYRIRAVATSLAFSSWATSAAVEPVGYGDALVLTSNARPDLTVAINHEPQVGYGFPDHAADVVMPLHGGDGHLVFGEPEDRGVETAWRAVVHSSRNPRDVPVDANGNMIGHEQMFQPLRDIARSPFRDVNGGGFTPYVCILDSKGGRRYGYVAMGDGDNRQPAHRYHVDLTTLSVTFTPTPDT